MHSTQAALRRRPVVHHVDKVYAIKLMMDTLIAEAKDIAQANA